MRTKGISAAALAALALSGVFAAGAHAEPSIPDAAKEEVTLCLETEADAAFMATHPPDRESQREASKELQPNQCITVWVSHGEVYDLAFGINPCLLREQASHQDQIGAGRAIIERCLAELPPGTVTMTNRHATKRKKKSKKARHVKRGHAQIALAAKR